MIAELGDISLPNLPLVVLSNEITNGSLKNKKEFVFKKRLERKFESFLSYCTFQITFPVFTKWLCNFSLSSDDFFSLN